MNKDDRNKLITDNLGLIHLVIKKLNLKWDTEDEHQSFIDSGLDGLINAAGKYNPESDNKFSTFACVCIKSMLCRNLYFKTRKKSCNSYGKDLSLNYLISDEDDIEFGDLIPDQKNNIEEQIEQKLEVERLLNAVNNLKNKKDALVVKKYYGLEEYSPKTFQEIADELNVSKSTVQFRNKRAIKNLKNYLQKDQRDVFAKEKGVNAMNKDEKKKENSMVELNNYLFNQLASLDDNSKDFEKEIRKSYATTQLAQQIINNANTMLKAAKLAKETNTNSKEVLKILGINNE